MRLLAGLILMLAIQPASAEKLFGIDFNVPASSNFSRCKISELGKPVVCIVGKGFRHNGILYAHLQIDDSMAPLWVDSTSIEIAINSLKAVDQLTVSTPRETPCAHLGVIESISKRFGHPTNSQAAVVGGGWQALWDRGAIKVQLNKITRDTACTVTFTAPSADERRRRERIEQSREQIRPASP